MTKLALILHGWPGYRLRNYFLTKYLENRGYKVLTPNMFVRGYIFSPENILKEIQKLSEGREIDVIFGISLGGLILPYIAKYYPKSKLIFVATGVSLNTRFKIMNMALKVFRYPIVQDMGGLFLKLPDVLISKIYKLVSPYRGSIGEKLNYKKRYV